MSTTEIEKIKELLPTDLFQSDDWKKSDVVGRVEWLLSMLEAKQDEINGMEDMLDRLVE